MLPQTRDQRRGVHGLHAWRHPCTRSKGFAPENAVPPQHQLAAYTTALAAHAGWKQVCQVRGERGAGSFCAQ
jgi:hypothetical protein